MKIAISGLGLIGGSFYKASLAAGYEVVGLHHGESAGLAEAELVIVCQPPEAIAPWIERHADEFGPEAIVVDVCGVKRAVMEQVAEIMRRRTSVGLSSSFTFVGGHPMAGREVSGFENSSAGLFRGASMILTPYDGTHPAVIEGLKRYFASIGFHETVVATPERHDDMIAFTSQLCHVIATVYAGDRRVRMSRGFTAGSYANMTRIATQDASVWQALYSENRDRLVGVLDDFIGRFTRMRNAIASDNAEAVRRIIEEGAAAKRSELLSRKRGDEDV